MKTLLALAAVVLALTVGPAAGATAVIAPSTDSNQIAYFHNVTPNSQFIITFTAYHYEGDPFPYTLGSSAYSNSVGVAKAIVSLDELASFYNGDAGPVYEVKACINTVPAQCTPDTYVGYYPESMWYYTG